MFNKIFRRGKTTKEDAAPIPSYKNSLKSPVDYEYGQKNFNLNNKTPYSTSPNTTGSNKYATTNDFAPSSWSTYDPNKYEPSPVNRTQNVYTAPPQRNLPYNQPNVNSREYEKPYQQFSVGSPTNQSHQYPSSYKPNNSGYLNKNDSTSGDRSPYIALGSTYSQNRPSYEQFKRDGSINRTSNSQPGTPTPSRRETYDTSPYDNRNTYVSTPNRTFESPQRDTNFNRSTFSPPKNVNSTNRYGTRVYESPFRENANKSNLGTYNSSNYPPDIPTRNLTSSLNQTSYNPSQESAKYDSNRNAYNSNLGNSAKPNYNDSNFSVLKPSFNASTLTNTSATPPSPEPGKYIPYAVRKALKESQQAQQQAQPTVNDNVRGGYHNYNQNNSNNPPTSKYPTTPYKPVYETPGISTNKAKSPYSNIEQSPYIELSNSTVGKRNFESPASRIASPPITNYNSKLYGQKSYEPPDLPPKNPALQNRLPELNRTFSPTANLSQNSTPSNSGYYNIDSSSDKKSTYIPFSNQTSYSPSIKPPTPSQNYTNLSPKPKPFSNPQIQTEIPNTAKNIYGVSNNTYTSTNPSSSNQYNNQFQNAEPSNNYLNTTNANTAYKNSIPSSFNDTATNSNSTHLSNNIFPNENKFNENNSSSRSTYEPQKNLYDTHQSYVQTPQYNYRSGEQTSTTPTNTNAFDDWLPKSISNLNENSSYGSTRNESELWKREKNNANASDFSSTAFGTVPSKLNADNYFNDKNNLNNDSSIKKDINFDRYSIPEQQIQPEKSLKLSLNNRTNQKPPLPLSSSLSSASYSVASPLLEAASISAAAANLSCQPENELDDYESESENLSSSEHINGVTSNETTKSKSPKKAVRFFNPIDKSREILSDIMAKGRNRGHHNKNRNNNNKNSNQKSNNNNKTESKTPLIVQNEINVDIKNLQNSNSASETNNNLKNNKSIKSEILSETDSKNQIGYQITKSKNSRDIVNKLQNTRAKLASPEEDESDNNFNVNDINSAANNNNHRNKFDDDTTDNTDTETLDEAFEDDESTFSSKNTAIDERNTENLVKSSSTSQNEIRNSKSACDNKFNNTESSSVGKSSAKNFQQQKQEKPSIQQVYHQQSVLQNSNLPSVNENNFDRDIRSSVRVGNTETQSPSRKKSSDTDFFANSKKHQINDKNAEQIEKIEKLSELTECDRDNFIKTQSSMGQNQTKTSAPTAKPESPRLVRSRSSSPPNRTVNKPTQLHSSDYAEIYKCSSQRDREPVIEEPLSPTTPLSPTESCDQFYDLTHDNNTTTSNSNNSANPLPKVTVADYSEDSNNSTIEPDIFYDFETVTTDFGNGKNLSKSPPKYPPPPPAPSAQFKSRSASPIDIVTLEDIEEEEDEEDEWHFIDDNGNDNNSNSVQQKQQQQQQNSTPKTQNYLSSPTLNRRNISSTSNSTKTSSPILTRKSPTPQRTTFDYENYSDGLNTPDSGIGGATTPISSTIHSVQSTTTANSSSTHNTKVLVINSCDLVNDTDDIELLQSHQKQVTNNYYNNTNINTVNFSDTNTFIENVTSEHSIINNSTSIVIDSISLPDVVIESKPKDTESQNNSSSTLLNVHNSNDYILNVSKSKSEGNVHFIPIHVEGREKPKIEIVEETTEFSGSLLFDNNNNNSITDNFNINTFNINNGFIEDISNQNNNNNNFNNSNSDNNNNYNININNDNNNNITVIKSQDTDNNKYKSENNQSSNNSYTVPLNSTSKNETTNKSKNNEDYQELENELQEELKRTKDEKQKKEEELKRELVNQEARFNAQLQEAQRNASSAQERAHELQMKIDQLEQDISLKSWHIERLNGEIQAIQKEHSSVRKRLQTIEDEKERIRQKSLDDEDEFNIKYENLEDKYKELEEKYEKLRQLGTSLQTQLAHAKVQADELQIEKEKLCEEKDAELKQLQELLDKAIEERKELDIKWQKEFELLRNHNQEHEEQLLTDCEFQLRSMQKKCKEKIEAAEKAKQEALERNEELEEKVAECEEYSERLKNLQAEVRQLRGLTNEQRQSISHMHIQIEELRTDLEAANLDLENKIEEVRKIKLYCDNTLLFKDREMIQKIDEATREVATIWEEKLLTEMTRLTNELEAVHSEERLSDMNKLQTEHIEELKVLTNRYTSNEEELRKELEEVSEKLQKKTAQYLELRDKTDTEILTTRITLDRADREYQQAMNRELDKKMELEEKLRKEYEKEKAEMEAEFQIRIEEVKDNFKKDMANQTQEIAQRHRQQLEQQWDQLVAEKEDALQTLEKRHKIKLEDQENRLRNLEAQHKRDMKDLKSAYDLDRSALQNRDIHNSQEIEQLHRKCRCLTNLFEEMRLRYERREPRPEDLREIDELRARCDSQERDLCELTERLREMQMQIEEMQTTTTEYQEQQQQQQRSRKKPVRKPPPKQIPISCDVIYEEENEETESLEDTTDLTTNGFNDENNNDSIHQNSTASNNQKTDDTVNNKEVEEEEDDEEEDEEEED